jgi:L,D-transpeptidase YcbB
MEVYSIFTVDVKKTNIKFGKSSHLDLGIKDCKKSFIPFLLIIFSVFVSFACNKSKKNTHRIDQHEAAIYSNENYSDLKLDSTYMAVFFKQHPVSDSVQNQIIEFYTMRNYDYAWLNKNGLTLAANNFYDQLHEDSKDFNDNSLLNKSLDSLFTEANNNEKIFINQSNNMVQLELMLTATFFKYAQKMYGGATASTKNLGWFIPRKKKNYLVLLDSLVSKNTDTKIQEPVNEYYTRLKEKLKIYRAIQEKGGFSQIKIDKKVVSIGDTASYILPLKQHLFLTEDLKVNDKTNLFTTELEIGISGFQHRMGLKENGKVDTPTLKELNETVDFRIKQIMVNLERLRWVPVEMEKDYLLVNIPEFRLHIFENQKQLWQTNVVVGKDARRTSIFRGNLSTVVLNPYWGIPQRIAKEEIIPKIKKNANYLANNNMEVIDGNYRQKPGVNNALGKIKFLFPNNYSIYLHDTPSKSLFDENVRAFSHGCIRVENPRKLAYYLLRKNSDWPESRINDVLKTNVNTNIKVSPTVPVYIAYFTAWVDNEGHMNFRHDLYNLDDKLSKEVFGEQ